MISVVVCCIAALLAVAVAIPIAILAIECIAGSWPARQRSVPLIQIRPPVAVLVPAHNESAGIAETLQNIHGEMRASDRLVVVADNCDDQTAQIACDMGAEVIERNDLLNRGKGYALDAGVQYLRLAPPRIVVIIDADCVMGIGALDQLAAAVVSTGRPAQARYLLKAPPNSGFTLGVAEFAFLVKNRLRPLGLSRLGLPCQLTGSGMAFPWSVLSAASLATGHRAEDMKLGLDLAYEGHPPSFCDSAIVTSQFPETTQGQTTQRQRWEGGHLSMSYAILRSLFARRGGTKLGHLVMSLDVIIPPLTLLVAAALALLIVNACIALLGFGTVPLLIAAANILLLAGAIGLAWAAGGRVVLPVRSLVRVPVYVASKLKLYPRAVAAGRNAAWIRTDRTKRD